jgi:hypothetical protein
MIPIHDGGTDLALPDNKNTIDDNPALQEDTAVLRYPTEVVTAYQWAFTNGITTLQPLENADPE